MNDRVIELESEISTIIKSDNGCETHFEYSDNYPGSNKAREVSVSVITYNPITKANFLLCQLWGKRSKHSKIFALEKALKYVKKHKKDYYTHTITWYNKGNKETTGTHTSYFVAENPLEALEKFYYEKDPDDYIVFSVILNPIS